jgi:hypothetical protein
MPRLRKQIDLRKKEWQKATRGLPKRWSNDVKPTWRRGTHNLKQKSVLSINGKNQLLEALSEPVSKKFAAQFKGLIIGLLIDQK